MLADHRVIADLVPVDLPVNMMIAVAWARANAALSPDISSATANSTAIYHITTGGLNPFTWGEMENAVISCFKNNPLESCFRRPKGNILTSNRSVNEVFLYGSIYRVTSLVLLVSYLLSNVSIVVRSSIAVSNFEHVLFCLCLVIGPLLVQFCPVFETRGKSWVR